VRDRDERRESRPRPEDPSGEKAQGLPLDRQPDQKGDRVKVTMSGKFLPYKRY
jgi:hypothetical protein